MKKVISLFLVLCLAALLPGCMAFVPADKSAADDEPSITATYSDLSVSYGDYEISFFNIERKDDVLSLDMTAQINNASAMMQDPYVAFDAEFTRKLNKRSYKADGNIAHIEYIIEDEADEIYIMPPAFVVPSDVETVSVALPSPEAFTEPFEVQYNGEPWFKVVSVEKNGGGEVVVTVEGCEGSSLIPRFPWLTVGKNLYSGGVDFSLNIWGRLNDQRMVFAISPIDMDKLDGMTLVIEDAFEIVSYGSPLKSEKTAAVEN